MILDQFSLTDKLQDRITVMVDIFVR